MAISATAAGPGSLERMLETIFAALKFSTYPGWPDKPSRQEDMPAAGDLLRLMERYLCAIKQTPELSALVQSMSQKPDGNPDDYKAEMDHGFNRLILEYVPENGLPAYYACLVKVRSEPENGTFWSYHEKSSVFRKFYLIDVYVAMLEYYHNGTGAECVMGVRIVPSIGEPITSMGLFKIPHPGGLSTVKEFREQIARDLTDGGLLPLEENYSLSSILGRMPALEGVYPIK